MDLLQFTRKPIKKTQPAADGAGGFPVRIEWPSTAHVAAPAGQYSRNDAGKLLVYYNDIGELRLAITVTQWINEDPDPPQSDELLQAEMFPRQISNYAEKG